MSRATLVAGFTVAVVTRAKMSSMINSRSQMPGGTRASFCHIEVPRTEQRWEAGRRPYAVFLVRLYSDLGDYPSSDKWWALRYEDIKILHKHLREHYRSIQLPWLPQMRWFNTRHPTYLAELCSQVQRYLQHLVATWLGGDVPETSGTEGLIWMLTTLDERRELPLPADLPPPLKRPDLMSAANTPRGSVALRSGNVTSGADTTPLKREYEELSWKAYQEHVEQRLLSAGGADTNPFEDEGELDEGLHCWAVESFSIRREKSLAPHAVLREGNAYIVLHSAEGRRVIFYWIGAKCLADKAGSAAVLAIQLHDLVDGGQHHCHQASDPPRILHRAPSAGHDPPRVLHHASSLTSTVAVTPHKLPRPRRHAVSPLPPPHPPPRGPTPFPPRLFVRRSARWRVRSLRNFSSASPQCPTAQVCAPPR